MALAQELIVSDFEVRPSGATLQEWMINVFQAEEVWVIWNKDVFFAMLDWSGASPQLEELLRKSFVETLPTTEGLSVLSLYGDPILPQGGYIVATDELKAKIPGAILREIYRELLKAGYLIPTLDAEQRVEIENELRSWNLPEEKFKEVQEYIFELDGNSYLPITPTIWPLMSESRRQSYIFNTLTGTDEEQVRKAIKVEIKIKSEADIQNVAHQFAGGRNPEILVRYLRQKLAQNGTGELVIALESLLHPFIRKNLNTFDEVGGPNCYNAGVCVHQGNKFEKVYMDAVQLNKILDEEYEELSEEMKLRPGDLLLYRNHRGEAVHVATYITDEIVFTKNGINKFTPYMFQNKKTMEGAYFPNGNFKVERYRPMEKKGTTESRELSILTRPKPAPSKWGQFLNCFTRALIKIKRGPRSY